MSDNLIGIGEDDDVPQPRPVGAPDALVAAIGADSRLAGLDDETLVNERRCARRGAARASTPRVVLDDELAAPLLMRPAPRRSTVTR
ncbi:MAG: hypothetical protein FWF28_09070 [Micrococcales bacterium]|nr:hypothetical protein [Micrococcales bacterium]